MKNSTDYRLVKAAAVIPGILMCLMTLGMLAADILYPGMDSAQYTMYPAVSRICGFVAAACGIVCVSHDIKDSGTRPDVAKIMLLLFVIWMIISTIVNGLDHAAVYGVPYRYLGVFEYIVCFAAYMECSSLIGPDRNRHCIMTGYMIVADLVAAAALFDRYVGAIPAFGNKAGLSAVFFHENHYGYFLVMAVLISAGYWIYGSGIQMAAGIVSFLINTVALGVNQTLGCILAVGSVIILMLIYIIAKERSKAARILILTVFLIIAAVAAFALSRTVRDDIRQLIFDIGSITWGGNHGFAGHGRWRLWTETVGYIKERPLFGFGCEGIESTLMDATGVSSPHNEILTYAAFFGIPGALLYATGITAALLKSILNSGSDDSCRIAFMAACGYFISSLFGVSMFYTLPLFFIFTGISITCSANITCNNNQAEGHFQHERGRFI